jgi:hypothetical protein
MPVKRVRCDAIDHQCDLEDAEVKDIVNAPTIHSVFQQSYAHQSEIRSSNPMTMNIGPADSAIASRRAADATNDMDSCSKVRRRELVELGPALRNIETALLIPVE